MKFPLLQSPQTTPTHLHHTTLIKKHKPASLLASCHQPHFSHSTPTPSNQTKTTNSNDHYEFKVGQTIEGYRITGLLGQGTFGRVLQGEKKGRRYAIKMIRSLDKYIESAKTQKEIIKNINKRDQKDEEGIVRYKCSFYHSSHFGLVFQPLGLSLYQLIKKNNYRGFSIKIVQTILRQIFKSIAFLHRIGYTHTDLKPQNILLQNQTLEEDTSKGYSYWSPASYKIRIIDFGGATLFNQPHSTIICTRQYRPPEVILQCCEWNQIADVWSIGCIALQLLTGDLLFPTHQDTEHLLMMQKNSGKFPQWMINKTSNSKLRRLFREGVISEAEAERELGSFQNIEGLRTSDKILGQHESLRELIRQCLQIDPNRRINCASALRHRFFQQKLT